jgi:hypothetical protein
MKAENENTRIAMFDVLMQHYHEEFAGACWLSSKLQMNANPSGRGTFK